MNGAAPEDPAARQSKTKSCFKSEIRSTAQKTRNPKHEIRNKSKSQMTEIQNVAKRQRFPRAHRTAVIARQPIGP